MPDPIREPARALLSPAQGWTLVAALSLAALGLAFVPPAAPSMVLAEPAPQEARPVPTISSGGNADSNNRMIAVTGMDVTGQSVLYLVDTENLQLAIYQASGGASSTQGVRLVGARNISLDLMLDGFNDKTTDQGQPLGYKELEAKFVSSGLLDGEGDQ